MAAVLCASACSVDPEVETVTLALNERAGCELGRPDSLELRALGDFPPVDKRLESDTAVSVFDSLPRDTRELLVRAEVGDTTAIGRRFVSASASELPLLVLPRGRSCPLGDPAVRAPDGAAVAPLPGGGFLVAGGLGDDGRARSDAVTFAPGAALAELVPNGMFLRRMRASATPVGSTLIVIAGGTADGSVHETYEVFDIETGSFAGSRGDHISGPRMDHAALVLADGRVLLVGGRAQADGEPLTTAELLDPSSRSHMEIGDSLVEARVSPTLLALDSGSVIVLGGQGLRGELVASLERLDPQTYRFTRSKLILPVRDEVVASALVGARIAWLGCDASATGQCALSLLFERGTDFVREDLPLRAVSDAPLGLSGLRMIALDSGRLLLTANALGDASASRRAFVIDLNQASIERLRDASRVPSALFLLNTGQVAELDAAGGSLREQDSLSSYDAIGGNLIDPDVDALALDTASHWQRVDAGLRALVAARLDLPTLRFSSLRAELEWSGDVELLFNRDPHDAHAPNDSSEPSSIMLAGGRVRAGGCDQAWPDGARLIVQRTQTRLTLQASPGPVVCELNVSGAVGVALRANMDAVIHAFSVDRR